MRHYRSRGAVFLAMFLGLAEASRGDGPAEPKPAPASAIPSDLASVIVELGRLTALVAEQNRALEALRSEVAGQKIEIDQLRDASLVASTATAPATGALPALAKARTPAPVAAAVQVAPARSAAPAQAVLAKTVDGKEAPPKRWFEKYAFRGYTQARNNRLFASNGALTCEQCDRSIGLNNGFFLRRARVILSGEITDRISLYLQPDFASTADGLHFGQIRDLYFDVALDKKREFRFRVGQSKVPYGFDNLQSSQNRLALDRSDPINSAFPNERDLGVFFYWAPDKIRKRFTHLVSSGLKGSGDYGVFGTGLFNGQTANRPEANNNLHYVARFSYPFELKNGQFLEAGIQTYTGRYAVASGQRAATTLGGVNFPDRRTALSFMLYPQPFGFQAEYNFGRGPRYIPAQRRIADSNVNGGYAQVMYMRRFHRQTLTPFFRYQYYDGGKKLEFDARSYLVREESAGLEWQPNSFLEFAAEYAHSDRTYEDSRLPNHRQKGNLLRLQMQVNY